MECHSIVALEFACSRLSVAGDERKNRASTRKKKGGLSSLSLFLSLALAFRSSPTTESLEPATPEYVVSFRLIAVGS